MLRKLLIILSLLIIAGCGGDKLEDIVPLEVQNEDSYLDINQEDFKTESDNIRPSVDGPSTPPFVNGPSTPPPNS